MSVKNLTLMLFSGIVLLGCRREPQVRQYMEITQAPRRPQVAGNAQALPPDHPLQDALPEGHPLREGSQVTETAAILPAGPLPEDHPLRQAGLPPDHPLRAAPLTVDPIPENLPPGHPTLADASPAVPEAPVQANRMVGREAEVPPPPAARDLAWVVPEGWRQRPGSGLRLATFEIAEDTSGAITTLVVLGAAAGGVEANISRWRAELGLPPDSPEPPLHIEGNLDFVLVNLILEAAQAGSETATLGAIFDLGDRTAFLKFMGRPEVLHENRLNFLSLAGSLRRTESAP